LYDSDSGAAHQVLAFGYEERGDEKEVYLYDPNHSANRYEGTDVYEAPVFSMKIDSTTGGLLSPYGSFDRYTFNDPELSLAVADTLVDRDAGVFPDFANSLVIGLNSPATLSINAPEGATVVQPGAEYATSEGSGFHDLAYVVNADPADYQIEVVGEKTGEYELEVFSVRDGNVVLDESTIETVESGARHQYVASISDSGDSGAASLKRTNRGGSDNTRQDTENNTTDNSDNTRQDTENSTTDNSDNTQQDTENNTTDGINREEEGLPSWLPLAGGAGLAGIVGVGIASYLRRGKSESENGGRADNSPDDSDENEKTQGRTESHDDAPTSEGLVSDDVDLFDDAHVSTEVYRSAVEQSLENRNWKTSTTETRESEYLIAAISKEESETERMFVLVDAEPEREVTMDRLKKLFSSAQKREIGRVELAAQGGMTPEVRAKAENNSNVTIIDNEVILEYTE
jgi:hypothetical protein